MYRSDKELSKDGFNTDDIRTFRKNEQCLGDLKKSLEAAIAEKDYLKQIELEPEIDKLDFLLKYQGKNPREVPLDELKAIATESVFYDKDHTIKEYRGRIKNPATGIRAFCMTCMSGQPSEVRRCQAMQCPLWPFRLGQNPFFGRAMPPTIDYVVIDDEEININEGEDEGDKDAD